MASPSIIFSLALLWRISFQMGYCSVLRYVLSDSLIGVIDLDQILNLKPGILVLFRSPLVAAVWFQGEHFKPRMIRPNIFRSCESLDPAIYLSQPEVIKRRVLCLTSPYSGPLLPKFLGIIVLSTPDGDGRLWSLFLTTGVHHLVYPTILFPLRQLMSLSLLPLRL